MLKGVKGVVEPTDFVFDVLGVKGPVSTVILEGTAPVSSLTIEGRSVEETCVGIPHSKPVNSGFNLSKFLLLLKDVTIIFSEIPFKVMEKVVGGVRRGSLDASLSGQDPSFLVKNVTKRFFNPSSSIVLEEG